MLVRLWGKGNPSALLVGMQTGAATVENSMEFPQETKNGTAFKKLLYCCSITVVCIFSPRQTNPPPSLASTFPVGFVHVSFTVVLENPSPHCPLLLTRQFHCWDYTLRILKHQFKRTYAPQCSQQHNLQ